MRNWHEFVRARLRLHNLGPDREARIVRELATQLEDFYREARDAGMSELDADAHACRQIQDWNRLADDVCAADRRNARSGIDRLTDRVADRAPTARGGIAVLADMLRDTRYGLRQLKRTPGFTVVAILTLTLGIGATSAIFSVVNGVLLRPLPYADPDRLARVYEIVPQYGLFAVAPASFLDWRTQNTVFERLAAYVSGSATIVGDSGPERISSAAVSWDTFDLLGVRPTLGRSFAAEEDAPGKDNVIVLSYSAWQRRFGGDPQVLGRTLALSGTPVTVVGVMPAGFYFPTREAEFWRPLALNPANASRGAHFLAVVGRLKPGIPLEQASSEMKLIAERLSEQYPEAAAKESAAVMTVHERLVGDIRPALLTLLGAVTVVVLVACANIANLLLVRASVRDREVAIRAALGAGRRRLALQMLAESLLLAVIGGIVGVALAYLSIPSIQALSAGSIPRVEDISLDGTVLSLTVLVSIATGLVFGAVPAWHASRTGLAAVLKEGGRSSISSRGRWVRSGLLIAEVALSIVLLVGATLLLRSFHRLTNVDPGFRAENVLTFRVSLPSTTYPEPPQRMLFYQQLLEKLAARPGVRSAALTHALPLGGDYVLSFEVSGRPEPKPGEGTSANYRSVSADYFATLGIPLLRGRTFSQTDRPDSPMVAIVDEAFARRHFPDEDPMGRGIDIGDGSDGYYEIVGVVGNVRDGGLASNPEPTMYVPLLQRVSSSSWVLMKTSGNPELLTATARQVVREVDPNLPAYSIAPLADIVTGSVAQRRFSMLLIGVFAFIALFLAAVGLYGVVAYTVSLRTQEIGVRMAIGAQRGDVLRLVVGGGMKLTLIGLAIGLVGALGLARFVKAMLFEVEPSDPASYVATAVVILATAALACYFPARRASLVDPLLALRQE